MDATRLKLLLFFLTVTVLGVALSCDLKKAQKCLTDHEETKSTQAPSDGDSEEEHIEKFHKDQCEMVSKALSPTEGLKQCVGDSLSGCTGENETLAQDMQKNVTTELDSLKATDMVCNPVKYGCDFPKLSSCFTQHFKALNATPPESLDVFSMAFHQMLMNTTNFCSQDFDAALTCAEKMHPEVLKNCSKLFGETVEEEKIPNMTKMPVLQSPVSQKIAEFLPGFFRNISDLICDEDSGCPDMSDRLEKTMDCDTVKNAKINMASLVREIINKESEKHDVKQDCITHNYISKCKKMASEGCEAMIMWREHVITSSSEALKVQDICKIYPDVTGSAAKHVISAGLLLVTSALLR